MTKQHVLELDERTERLIFELREFFHVDDFPAVLRRSLALAKLAMDHADKEGRLAICSDHDHHLMMIDLKS